MYICACVCTRTEFALGELGIFYKLPDLQSQKRSDIRDYGDNIQRVTN